MRSLIKILLLAALLYNPINLLAQKDKLVLACPFLHGTGREPKEPFTWEPPEHKVIFISTQDSLVRSCVPGEVIAVQPNEESRYEIVIFYKEHYFWYNNVLKPRVNVKQKLVSGQTIGTYQAGEELELRVAKELKKSDDPEEVDPREWLECKILKAN